MVATKTVCFATPKTTIILTSPLDSSTTVQLPACWCLVTRLARRHAAAPARAPNVAPVAAVPDVPDDADAAFVAGAPRSAVAEVWLLGPFSLEPENVSTRSSKQNAPKG